MSIPTHPVGGCGAATGTGTLAARRDAEFEGREVTREELLALWEEAWELVERELAQLTAGHLRLQVTIRGQCLTVHAALARSVAHVAYHVGQIVLLARVHAPGEWRWISIPKGRSEEYDRALQEGDMGTVAR